MPKMKTNSGAKKRFRTTKSGKIKSGQAKTSHMMMNKSKSMKRKARRTMTLSKSDTRIIMRSFLPYARKTKKVAAAAKDGE